MDSGPLSRRGLLQTAGITTLAALAGCSGGSLPFTRDKWPTTSTNVTDPFLGYGPGWPQYGRTNAHSGFASEIVLSNPHIAWRFTLPGSISSPAVAGGRVLLHGGVPTDSSSARGVVVSLRATDGSQQWRRPLPSEGGGYSGCPPIVYHGSVYVGNASPSGLYAIDAHDGSRRWHHETSSSINQAALGYANKLFASTGSRLLAFDERGHQQWTYQLGSDRGAVSVPTATANHHLLYATTLLASVVAIDPVSGPPSAWRYLSERAHEFGTPTVADGTAYVSGTGRIHAIDLQTGTRKWVRPVKANSGIATDRTRLFVTTKDGGVAAYASSDGSKQWHRTLASQDGVSVGTRPLVTAKSVIITTSNPQRDENVTAYALDRASGVTRWSLTLPGNVSFDAVADAHRVYIPVYWSTRQQGGTLVTLTD